ncbi:MAG: hypothetical protein HY849_07690 [Nitrosomonadales bacterium]|nr:hypothetical protein [Nitrosomonadales bacterium]
MNRLKAGKILRVPAAGDLENVTQKGAEKVIHAQVTDWNGYRRRVAGTRLATRDNSASRETSGKIGTSIDAQDAADHASPEVLKLSKGEAPGDKAGANEAKSLREKVRSMEEEMTAQGKSLQEKNERIALLEKNNREMQRLLELKSGLAVPASQPVAAPVAASAVVAASAPLAASAVEAVSAPVAEPVSAPHPAAPPVEEPVVEEEDNSALYIGGGLLALLGLGGGAWFAFGRKKPAPKKPVTRPAAPKKEVEPEPEPAAPLSPFPEEEVVPAAAISAAAAAAVLAEEAYSAQAEPASNDMAQPDFYSPQAEPVAPSEPEFHFESPAVYEPEPVPETLFTPEPDPYVPPPFTDDVELVMEEEDPQDFAASAFDLPAAELDPFQADEAVSEFAEAETAYAEPAPEPVAQADEADSYPNFDVPSLFSPEPVAAPEVFDAEPAPAAAPAAAPVAPPAAGSDFALDIPSFSEQVVGDALPSLPGMAGVSLDVADVASAASEPEVGGEQWMNVATKLDLARAYQEMGDSAGAREILEEVLSEGDSGQRNTAELLLQQLSA